EAHPALASDIVRIDHIHVAALLISQDRGARHGDNLPWLDRFEENGDELVSYELAKPYAARRLRRQDRIRNHRTDKQRVGVERDGIVHEIELANLIINSTVRQANSDFHRVETALIAILFAQLDSAAGRDRKYRINRILTDHCDQCTGRRADQIPNRR